ncbi:MAG TPA: hypothetical protein VFZ31_00255 [Vicinamibacterales bacterium]
MPLDRRQLILAAAAVIVLGLAVWTLWPSSAPPPASAPPAQARARGGRTAAAAESGPVGAVKLGALTASAARNQPGDARRNPFRFQPKVVAPPPRTTPPPAPITDAPKPVVTERTGPAPRQPIGLKFLGVLQRANGVKWAVLSDGKSPTPMYGKDGDIIDGKYLIVKIGTESIEMAYTDGTGRQVIRLTGQ